MTFQRPILWIHEEALGPANPALRAWPDAPALFVFDTHWIEANRISRKRLGFLYEAALEQCASRGEQAARSAVKAKSSTPVRSILS